MITHGLRIIAHFEGLEVRYNPEGPNYLQGRRSWTVHEVQPGVDGPGRVLESKTNTVLIKNPRLTDPIPELVGLSHGIFSFSDTIDMGWAIAVALNERRAQFQTLRRIGGADPGRKQYNFPKDGRPRVASVEIGMIKGTQAWDANLFLVSRQLTVGPEQTLAAPGHWVGATVWHPRSVALRMLRDLMFNNNHFADHRV